MAWSPRRSPRSIPTWWPRDKGQIETVRYTAVNAMLLNEFLKEHKAFVAE